MVRRYSIGIGTGVEDLHWRCGYVVIVPKCQMYSMTIGLPIYVASAPLRRLPHSPCLAGSNNSGQKTHVAYPKGFQNSDT